MSTTDFEALFLKADNLRNSGRVDAAIAEYAIIARTAEELGLQEELGRALHGAAIASFQNIDSAQSSYLRDGLQYLHQAAEVYRGLDDTIRLGMIYRDAGGAYSKAKFNTEALEYFQKSIAELAGSNEYGELGSTYSKLGKFYLRKNDIPTAEQYFHKALENFKKDPTKGFLLASTLYSLASLHVKKGDYLEAYEIASQSLGWFTADHAGEQYTYRQTQLYGLLSVICAQIAREKEATNYGVMYEKNLKNMDPRSAKGIQTELESLL